VTAVMRRMAEKKMQKKKTRPRSLHALASSMPADSHAFARHIIMLSFLSFFRQRSAARAQSFIAVLRASRDQPPPLFIHTTEYVNAASELFRLSPPACRRYGAMPERCCRRGCLRTPPAPHEHATRHHATLRHVAGAAELLPHAPRPSTSRATARKSSAATILSPLHTAIQRIDAVRLPADAMMMPLRRCFAA